MSECSDGVVASYLGGKLKLCIIHTRPSSKPSTSPNSKNFLVVMKQMIIHNMWKAREDLFNFNNTETRFSTDRSDQIIPTIPVLVLNFFLILRCTKILRWRDEIWREWGENWRKWKKDEGRNEKRRGNIWNRDVEQIVESTKMVLISISFRSHLLFYYHLLFYHYCILNTSIILTSFFLPL